MERVSESRTKLTKQGSCTFGIRKTLYTNDWSAVKINKYKYNLPDSRTKSTGRSGCWGLKYSGEPVVEPWLHPQVREELFGFP